MNEEACGTGGMILTQENPSTWRETCLNAAFSTTSTTWTGLGLNLGLHHQAGKLTT